MSDQAGKIDSHHHLWAYNPVDYVWMGEAHAAIRRDFVAADLDAALDAGGLDGSVAVQARQLTIETEWLLGLAETNPRIRGVVGWVPLCDRAGEPWLERFAAHPRLAGVRHVVHDEADDDFILREDFNRGIARLAAYGLVYDILIFPRHLPQTMRFVDRHPNQVFVLDHLAKPHIRRAAFDSAWAAGLRELARRPNISCKVSGMLTEVRDDSFDADLLRPYFETALEAFGPERLMFGSDWPVCLLRAGYAGWARLAAELAAPLDPAAQAAFWGGNAARIYRLGKNG
jgi:L-fuconolactonase